MHELLSKMWKQIQGEAGAILDYYDIAEEADKYGAFGEAVKSLALATIQDEEDHLKSWMALVNAFSNEPAKTDMQKETQAILSKLSAARKAFK